MSVHAEEGTTIISLGENNFLTEHDGHAVVGLSTETKWRIKAYQPSDDSPPFFMILLNSEGPEELCLALDTNEGDNENNVMLELLETPRPKTCQLWTFEEKAVMERLPPIMKARIQSAARPWLSAAIGGDVPLPRLYQNIAAVPNDTGSQAQKWKLDYVAVNE